LESDLFLDTVIDNSNSTKTNTKKKRLRDGIKFHMYISQAPCGDASMLQLNLSQTPSQKTLNEHKKLKTSHDIVLRGRLDYHEFGRLRTKPGRLDSEISTCLSCSDKIAKWNWLGYQGSLLSLFMEPVYISTIVIGDYFDREQITRSLLRTNGFQPVIQSTTVIFPFSKSQMDTKASDVGYSWNKFDGLECLVKGMKQGSAKVCFKTASLISKVKMAELVWEKRDFALVEFQSGIEYGKLKDLAIEYQERKERLYANEFKGWLVSPKETFLVPFARDLL
jgi:tRNA-specific adenosine deaminase 1